MILKNIVQIVAILIVLSIFPFSGLGIIALFGAQVNSQTVETFMDHKP